MKKEHTLIVSVFIIIVAAVALFFLLRQPVTAPENKSSDLQADAALSGDSSFALACEAGKSLLVTFHLPENKTAEVVLSDGRSLDLKPAQNTSQAAVGYETADHNTILVITQTGAFLTEKNVTTYANCAPTESGTAEK